VIIQDNYQKLILFDCQIKWEGSEIAYILAVMGFYDIGLPIRRELFQVGKQIKSLGHFILPQELYKARSYGSVFNLVLEAERKNEQGNV
jgi:hypothetical protein